MVLILMPTMELILMPTFVIASYLVVHSILDIYLVVLILMPTIDIYLVQTSEYFSPIHVILLYRNVHSKVCYIILLVRLERGERFNMLSCDNLSSSKRIYN